MSPNNSSVFFLGATGFLGGQLLADLGQKHPEMSIYALLRNPDKITALKKLHPDVTPIVGTLDDFELIKEEAQKHPIVINTASSDHEKSVEATLAGLKENSAANPGKPPLYIHTSGQGFLSDNSRGEPVPIEKVWSDVGLDLERDCNPNNFHLNCDIKIVNAGKRKEHPVRTIIIFPCWIYGISDGPQKTTLPVRIFFDLFKKAGHAGTWGPGANKMANIHVKDLAKALLLALDAALNGTAEEGPDGLYFVGSENPMLTMHEVMSAYGNVLYSKGLLPSPESKPLPEDVLAEYGEFGWSLLGGNVIARTERIHRLGWEPVVSKEITPLDSLEEEVSIMLENQV